MKRYVLLALILAAGLSAYPQATRSARQSSSKSSSSRSAAVKSSGSSSSRSAVKSNSGSSNKSATTARSSQSRTNQSKAVQSKATNPVKSNATRSSASQSGNRSSNNQGSRGSSVNQAVRSSSNANVKSSGSSASRSSGTTGSAVRREVQVKSSSATRSSNTGNGSAVRSDNRSDNRTNNSGSATRSTERIQTSSASRTVKEGKDYLVTADGRTVRHQNNDVFTHRKYDYNFRNRDELRRSHEFNRALRDYNDWHRRRVVRVVHYNRFYRPLSIDIRRVRYVYRQPYYVNMIWTPTLYHRFMFYYPHWDWDRRYYQDYGSSVETVSSYEASDNIGLVKRVYGKVEEVYYSQEEENYILYFGAPFPYHDFSVVIPRGIAREISLSPSWYFKDEHVWVVGLIETWEDKPEMVVHDEDQIRRY